MERPQIRCIAVNGNHEPSPWMRNIYAHRDRIECLVRGIHEPVPYADVNCGRSTVHLMGISYNELLDRAHRHLVDVVLPRQWSDPVI